MEKIRTEFVLTVSVTKQENVSSYELLLEQEHAPALSGALNAAPFEHWHARGGGGQQGGGGGHRSKFNYDIFLFCK